MSAAGLLLAAALLSPYVVMLADGAEAGGRAPVDARPA